jgi:hypothetical protein
MAGLSAASSVVAAAALAAGALPAGATVITPASPSLGGGTGLTAAGGGRFFSTFAGPHRGTSLLVDERAGAVGPVRLGMRLGKAQRLLGSRHLWREGSIGGRLAYCGRVVRGHCFLPTLTLWTAGPLGSAAGPDARGPVIREIDLTARAYPDGPVSGGTDATTLGGVPLGARAGAIGRAYPVAHVVGACLAFGAAPGKDYYVSVGSNSLAFEARRGRVVLIALYAGHGVRDC